MKYIFTLLLICINTYGQTDKDWNTLGGNIQHTNYIQGTISNLSLNKVWTRNKSFQKTSKTIINQGILYGFDGPNIFALKLNNGEKIWQLQLPPAHHFSAPTFSNGKLYFIRENHNNDSHVICLDSKTGKELWKSPFSTQWSSYLSPIVSNNTVYINAGLNGGLYGFDAESGSQLFAEAFNYFEDSTPSYYNGHIYTWGRYNFSKHDPDTGVVLESLNVSSTFVNNVTCSIADNTAFVTDTNTLYAIDIISMQIKWQQSGVKKCTPAVANGLVYAATSNSVKSFDVNSGNESSEFSTGELPEANSIIASNDKLYVSSENSAFIFDLANTQKLHQIDNGGELSVGLNHLAIAGKDYITCYSLSSIPEPEYNPFGQSDSYKCVENETLIINAFESILGNDTELNNQQLSAEIKFNPANGTVILNTDGTFSYTPKQNFIGKDIFYYVNSDSHNISQPIKVEIDVISGSSPRIEVKIFKDGTEVSKGESVSGLVTGEFHIYNAMHQHAQFYKNFRTLKVNEHGHMIMHSHVVKTFTVDTSEFFDGENLISAHAHPHNVLGETYKTDFIFGKFTLNTLNNNPAPNGDTELPELIVDSSKFQVNNVTSPFKSASLLAADDAIYLTDDGSELSIDHAMGGAGNAQIISHLGASVLGRFRWTTLNPPFAEDAIVSGVRLINFQQSEDKYARIIFFIQDEVGRANYAYLPITIPGISTEDRNNYPLPSLDAHIENVKQGDSIIIPDGEDFKVKVKVTNPGPLANTFKKLSLWVGNRSVSIVDISQQLNDLEEETEFYVDLPLPAAEIQKFQLQRENGSDSSAFALWVDFTNGNFTNLPTSEHVHLDSIRTLSQPHPFGPPAVHIIGPNDQVTAEGGININAKSYGKTSPEHFLWVKVDNDSPVQIDQTGSISFDQIPRGQHTYTVFLGDENGNSLGNEEASLTREFTIINAAPESKIDFYNTQADNPLVTDSSNKALANDTDLEGDSLTAELYSQPENGTVLFNLDGSFTYTPDNGFIGIDTFEYRAYDGFDYSGITLITVKVGDIHSIDYEWVMSGSNLQHTGHAKGAIENLAINLQWEKELSARGKPPVINNGIVYLIDAYSTKPGTLSALSMKNGQTIWSRLFPTASNMSPPTYADDNIYFQYTKNIYGASLYSLNSQTGETNWKTEIESEKNLNNSPIVINERVHAATDYFGGLTTHNQQTGEQLYRIGMNQAGSWTPSFYNSHIYTCVGGILRKHDETNGAILDSLTLLNVSYGTVVAIDSDIAFVTLNSTLFAVDLTTMELMWQQPVRSGSDSYPVVANGMVYVKSFENHQRVLVFDYHGNSIKSFDCPEDRNNTNHIITDNLLFVPGKTNTYIFDIVSGEQLHSIENTGHLVISNNTLFITANDKIFCYSLNDEAITLNHPPVAINDKIKAYENESIDIIVDSLTKNDFDDGGQVINFQLITSPSNGQLTLNNGILTYTPNADFSGEDQFTYKINDGEYDSNTASVKISIIDSSSTHIRIKLFKDGQEIKQGEQVSGNINGEIHIYNAMHQHAQFYKNFRTLKTIEHGHMIISNYFKKTFDLDTSEFFDGENLISVHTHPHNVEGEPYNTEFTVGSLTLVTSNNNPAPNGDTELPQAIIDESDFSISTNTSPSGTHRISIGEDSISIIDENERLRTDQSSQTAGNVQIIPHLGSSVLGRFRWVSSSPPWAENGAVFGTSLVNFQKENDHEATIVFFIQDEVGRANYAYSKVIIPGITQAVRDANPLPNLDAEILNLHQGESLIIPDGEEVLLKVKIKNPGSLTDYYQNLNLWIGNRSVKTVNFFEELKALPEGETEFIVDIPLTADEIIKLQNQRVLGQGSSAFALWVDFAKTNSINMPSSEHIHLDSIRSISRPWPFGPPAVKFLYPEDNLSVSGGTTVKIHSFGNLPEGYTTWLKLNDDEPQEVIGSYGSIDFSSLNRGDHSFSVFLKDSEGNNLTNPEASSIKNISIVNELPKANPDSFSIQEGRTLNISAAQGVLTNDTDLEGDSLTSQLITSTQNGTLSLSSDGSFTYLPKNGFYGIDSFTYAANDSFGNSNTVIVNINVIGNGFNGMQSAWNQLGQNSSHTNYVEGIIENLNPVQEWRYFNYYTKQVTIHDGVAYLITNQSGSVLALSLKDGKKIWEYNAPSGTYFSSLLYDEGNLFFQRNTSSESQLYSLNAATGEENWVKDYDSRSNRVLTPVIGGDSIFVMGGPNGGFYSFDKNTGAENYFIAQHQYDNWAPTYYDGHVYVWIRGELKKYNAETGALVKASIISHTFNASTASIKDDIVFAISNNTMFAINNDTFEVLWEAPAYNSLIPTLGKNSVFIRPNINYSLLNEYDYQGNLIRTYDNGENISINPLVTNDKLFIKGSNRIKVYDIEDGSLLETINNSGAMSMADGYLMVSTTSYVYAYKLYAGAAPGNHAPHAIADGFHTMEGQSLEFSTADLLTNDLDFDENQLSFDSLTQPGNGQITIDGDLITYQPNSGFSGYDYFTYRVNDGELNSAYTKVAIKVIDGSSSHIKFTLFKDGQPVEEGEEISGIVTGSIEINNAMHQHAQFYKNFRTLEMNEHGHMVTSNQFIKTFTLDTSEFYDGENLLSAHVHPHNVEGQPYNTDFSFSTFKMVTNNSNPAPNGDTKLPMVIVDETKFSINHYTWPFASARLMTETEALRIEDDEGVIDIDQSSSKSNKAQLISHLGSSVLGRFRWSTQNPPFGERQAVNDVRLINFQETEEREARIIFFASDEVGRANYGYVNITIPALHDTGRSGFTLPGLDASIENIKQGDTILVPDGEDFIVKVKVKNPLGRVHYFGKINLWVGNRSVNIVDISDKLESETEFFVDIPIPADEIQKLQLSRASGQDSSAFAIWLDFPYNNNANMPTSEHVHVDSIRTISRAWPYGEPTVKLISPDINHSQFGGTIDIQAASYGNLPENSKIQVSIDNGSPQVIEGLYGSVTFTNLSRGPHEINAILTEQDGTVIPNSTAEVIQSFSINNAAPNSSGDYYSTDQSLNASIQEGVLANDFDLENDSLSVELLTNTANGSLSLNQNGSFTYTANLSFIGVDQFSYRVFDGFDYSEAAVVYIAVNDGTNSIANQWHAYGNGVSHTSYNSGFVNEFHLFKLWESSLDETIVHPVINEGTVYFVNEKKLNAVDIKSGSLLWQTSLESTYSYPDYTPPTYYQGNLYIQRNASYDTALLSIDASSGQINWSVPYSGSTTIRKGPTVADDKIFINSSYGYLSAFDLTGNLLHSNSIGSQNGWTPTFHQDYVYTWVNGTLKKFDPDSGNETASLELIYDSWSNVMVAKDGIGYMTAKGNLYAVDLSSMELIWQKSCSTSNILTLTVSNDLIFVRSQENSTDIKCFNSSGQFIKLFRAPNTITNSAATAVDNKLFVPGVNETYVFDIFSARLEKTLSHNDAVYVSGDYLISLENFQIKAFLIDGLHSLNARQSSNGAVNLIEKSTEHGTDQFINVTADPNFQVKSILINGVSHPVPAGQTNYSFIIDNVSEDINIEAEFEAMPLVTVNSGSGDGKYATGSTVTVTADQVSGQYFTHWSGNTSGLDDANSTSTRLLVGSSDITLTANYALIQPKPFMAVINDVTDQFQTVTLPESYISPVIVTTPVNTNGAAPIVTRISNVTENSFDIKVQSADGSTNSPGTFAVTYMVVEEGVFNEADHGIKMEAFLHDSQRTDNKSSWLGESVAMINSYSSPVVFGQVMSFNDTGWSTFWAYGNSRTNPVSNGSLHIGKHVAEDSSKTRADETLGCIIVEQGQVELNGNIFNFLLGADTVSGVSNGGVNYSGLSGDVAVATLNGLDGTDGGWAVLYGSEKPESGNLKVAVDEDTISDSERGHTTEQLSIATMGAIPNDELVDDFYVTSVDTQLDILDTNGVLSNDTTSNSEVELLSGVSNGTLTLNSDGSFSYNPTGGFAGIDKFTYQLAGTDTPATVTLAVKSSNGALRDVYLGITGMNLTQLRESPVFDSPDISDTMTDFEGPTNWANSYATRLRARVIAPVSGTYTFYVAGDDSSELLFSSFSHGLGASKISYINGWTSSRQWTKYSSQKSASIVLSAGQVIYLEALSIEGGGGDNISAGWSIDGGDISVISNEYLMQPIDNGLIVSDIGTPAFNTFMTENSGSFFLSASGKDIWGNSDQFGFVNKDAIGDVELVSQVESLENTNAWAKAGVMIRESLNANSKHAMTVVTPANGVSFQRRTGTGSASASTKYAGLTAPQWVKILRQGDKFSSYYSSGGSVWFPVGSASIAMPENVKIGMALTSHNNSTEADALLSNFTSSNPAENLSITRFILVNADTGQDIRELTHNSTVNLSTDGTNLSIRAEGSGLTESVTFSIDGADAITEDLAPFALKGKSGSDYTAWSPQAGSYTILATPYSGNGAQGSAGSSLAIVINVTQ